MLAAAALLAAACTGQPVPPPQGAPTPPTPPASTTAPPATAAPAEVTVTVVGDIMLGRRVAPAAARAGDPVAPLRPMAPLLGRADVTIGNLESTLSQAGPPRQGKDSFAAPATVADGLAGLGFDVLTLANNHVGDFGPVALSQTVQGVEEAGIAPLGAGDDDEQAWAPVVVERNGLRIGLLAFNAIGESPPAGRTPGVASFRMRPRTGPVRPAELATLTGRVRELAARTDVVIVLPHWGDQYTHRPVPDQSRVGRALIDAGATVVVGGHPHWVQQVEQHGSGFIVHSLGNFVFDMDFSRKTREGAALTMTFRGDRLVDATLTPYVIDDRFAPQPVDGSRADSVLTGMRGRELLP